MLWFADLRPPLRAVVGCYFYDLSAIWEHSVAGECLCKGLQLAPFTSIKWTMENVSVNAPRCCDSFVLFKEQQTRERGVLKPCIEEKTYRAVLFSSPSCAALSLCPIRQSIIHPFCILHHVGVRTPFVFSRGSCEAKTWADFVSFFSPNISLTVEGRHEAVRSECAFIINSRDFTYI